MRAFKTTLAVGAGILISVLTTPNPIGAQSGGNNSEPFTDDFMLENCTFSSSGSNPFFVLQPGYQTVFRGEEDGETVVNTITVTKKTKQIGSVVTRVVEERETHNGQLVEVSRNYFAICTETNSVFYYGEQVDLYVGGVIVDHGGSWLAGVNGAKPGLIMPGIVLLGSRFFQEVAPGVAMDQAEIEGMHESVATPAGTFDNCIRTEETTPLEPKALEFKLYSPGVGLVQDDTLLLVRYGFVRL